MKIKLDFVTNSSSTSFLIICDEALDLNEFLSTLGVQKDSPFEDIFVELYEVIEKEMHPLSAHLEKENLLSHDAQEEYIKDRYSKEVHAKILEAEKQGRKVFWGQLSSESDDVERFFCTDSFILDGKGIYIDGTEYYW